jgi:mediator of RNA polymerase II transcription subunit 24
MLLECTPILDDLDTIFQCNSIECMLIELKKQNLVNEEILRKISDKRALSIAKLEKFHIPSTAPAIDKFVMSIDTPITGFLNSLRDPVKPEFVNVLKSLIIDNRAYLLYSAAALKGKHRAMISGLMKLNELCKEVLGEAAKSKPLITFRSNLFDISFLMLFSIMQKCGNGKFPEINGDFFFEKWIREGMIDLSKPKSPLSIVRMSDQTKVDELITYFNDSSVSTQPPPSIAVKMGEICWTIPSMLYNLIIAWENDTIKPQTVKNILDNMRSKCCCYAVVAASWLCAYMRILRDDEMKKPQFMVQILTKTLDESVMTQETFAERFELTHEIIMKLIDEQATLDVRKPMNNVFNEQWKDVMVKRWLPYDVAVNFEDILKSCGPFWLMKNLIDQILQAKFIKDMENTLDIAFAVMHLNIEACTETLLKDILIVMMFNKNQ